MATVGFQKAAVIKSFNLSSLHKLPSHMQAWQCLRFLDPSSRDVTQELHLTTTRRLPTLTRPDHVLVKVEWASINPIDLMNLYGYGSTISCDSSQFPWTPGRDFTGTIVRSYTRVVPGQQIVGVTWPFLSRFAQFVVCPAAYTAELPPNVNSEQAAAIGYSGLTAWSALVTAPMVLVTGATGGVGLVAAQLAKLSGACVHVTCPSDKRAIDMMRQLEVDDVSFTAFVHFLAPECYACVMNNSVLAFDELLCIDIFPECCRQIIPLVFLGFYFLLSRTKRIAEPHQLKVVLEGAPLLSIRNDYHYVFVTVPKTTVNIASAGFYFPPGLRFELSRRIYLIRCMILADSRA
ncbi:unnamed protein product [Echinostoma caproni]|uniref:PKS_ER domain-containing protein n=1 Tax=Echinostoma caproni TaxID=27848 RepID=A0A183AMX0_9TREM|nr:unnamed protein product [Echinostoma caproni]